MPIYEYECRSCGPFSEARPMAVSALPSVCPLCTAQAQRVLSATAIAIGRGGGGRRRRGGSAEPAVVTVKDRRKAPNLEKKKSRIDPLRAPRRSREAGRPWMVGH
jgi:putative FmdB family regulatory protein